MRVTEQIIERTKEQAPMDKKLLKILNLAAIFNFLFAFWGVETCCAQTVTGSCSDYYKGGCFAQFANEPVTYITNSFQPDNCSGGTGTATITVSGPVQISWTNNEERYPVNVSFNDVAQTNPFTISSSGTLTWGTTWCNNITFTFSAINQATDTQTKK